MKNFYSDYAAHCLRFKARYNLLDFTKMEVSDVGKWNWEAAFKAITELSLADEQIIVALYSMNGSLHNLIPIVSKEFSVAEDYIWKIANEVERNTARYRGLL